MEEVSCFKELRVSGYFDGLPDLAVIQDFIAQLLWYELCSNLIVTRWTKRSSFSKVVERHFQRQLSGKLMGYDMASLGLSAVAFVCALTKSVYSTIQIMYESRDDSSSDSKVDAWVQSLFGFLLVGMVRGIPMILWFKILRKNDLNAIMRWRNTYIGFMKWERFLSVPLFILTISSLLFEGRHFKFHMVLIFFMWMGIFFFAQNSQQTLQPALACMISVPWLFEHVHLKPSTVDNVHEPSSPNMLAFNHPDYSSINPNVSLRLFYKVLGFALGMSLLMAYELSLRRSFLKPPPTNLPESHATRYPNLVHFSLKSVNNFNGELSVLTAEMRRYFREALHAVTITTMDVNPAYVSVHGVVGKEAYETLKRSIMRSEIRFLASQGWVVFTFSTNVHEILELEDGCWNNEISEHTVDSCWDMFVLLLGLVLIDALFM